MSDSIKHECAVALLRLRQSPEYYQRKYGTSAYGFQKLALLLEKRAGQIAPQGWEFYAITGTLFITLAFPGFVYRYLVRRRD